MYQKRVLLADDHAIVRFGVREILKPSFGLEIVAEAEDGKQAIDLILEQQPDIAILDYSLPLINGLEVTRQLTSARPSLRGDVFMSAPIIRSTRSVCLGKPLLR